MSVPATIRHWSPSLPFIEEGGISLSRNEQGWDEARHTYIGRTSSPDTFMSTHWPEGGLLTGFSNIYITDVSGELDGDDTYRFTVQGKGLLGTKSVKAVYASRSQSYQTTSTVLIPGNPEPQKAQGIYVNPSVTFYAVTSTPPATTTKPQDMTPLATLPLVPPNQFLSPPDNPVYNFPYGWVCEGQEWEQLYANPVYLIRQDWIYRYEYMPG